jgi:hypothetical protein
MVISLAGSREHRRTRFAVIGPATWLALGLVDSRTTLSERIDLSTLELPLPPNTVKKWPLIGEPIYQFWELASRTRA